MLALLILSGCSDHQLTPCNDTLSVAITSPSPLHQIPQGFPLELSATIRNTCGGTVLESAIYSLSSDIDGNLAGNEVYAENEYTFSRNQVFQVGTHVLALRATTANGEKADDQLLCFLLL